MAVAQPSLLDFEKVRQRRISRWLANYERVRPAGA